MNGASISALTVARCPATFPGVWPQLRDTLSTSRSAGRGTGAFIYLPPFSENSPIFCSFPFAKIQPVFLPEQTGRMKHRTPFSPPATPAGITHYTLQAKSCAKGGTPLAHPGQQNRRYAALSGSIPPFCCQQPVSRSVFALCKVWRPVLGVHIKSAVLFTFSAPVGAFGNGRFIQQVISLREWQSLQNTVNLHKFHIMLGMAILLDCFPDFLYSTHFNPFLSLYGFMSGGVFPV